MFHKQAALLIAYDLLRLRALGPLLRREGSLWRLGWLDQDPASGRTFREDRREFEDRTLSVAGARRASVMTHIGSRAERATKVRVGLIGLGRMGAAIAHRLQGQDVTVTA